MASFILVCRSRCQDQEYTEEEIETFEKFIYLCPRDTEIVLETVSMLAVLSVMD